MKVKKVLSLAILAIFAVSVLPTQAQVSKHALAKVITAPLVMAKKAPTGFAKAGAAVLFAVETGVDGAHLAFFTADKAFDILSLKGKIPVLDIIYGGVSIANTDTGRLDTGIENLEVRLWGYHN